MFDLSTPRIHVHYHLAVLIPGRLPAVFSCVGSLRLMTALEEDGAGQQKWLDAEGKEKGDVPRSGCN
jgi:hypothetical protein